MVNQKKQLYMLAKQLYEENFWNDYSKTDLIAIQLSNRNEPVIISVLGKNQHNFGFLFHRNLEELACFFEATIKINRQEFSSMLDIIQVQHCLSLEFEDRMVISEEEYQLIKKSGVHFRGKKSWPVFIDYFPGYHPTVMDESERPLVIEIMEKLLETGKDFREKLACDKKKKRLAEILMRTYQNDGSYVDGLFILPTAVAKGISQLKKTAPVLLTHFEMKRVSSQKMGSSIWELDIDFINKPVVSSDGKRSYFPVVLLIVDSEENTMICNEFFKPGDSEMIQRFLIQLILSENRKPPKIVVHANQHYRVARYLENLLINLEIELVPIQKLPMISVLKNKMTEFL